MKNKDSGSILIEFIVVLPLLLLLLLGIFDFGMLFQRYQVLTNAAREGARMAVLSGYADQDISDRVNGYLVAGGVTEKPTTTPHFTTITPSTGPAFTVCEVTVTVDYTFLFIGSVARLFGASFGTTTLKAQSTMRTEIAAGGV